MSKNRLFLPRSVAFWRNLCGARPIFLFLMLKNDFQINENLVKKSFENLENIFKKPSIFPWGGVYFL